MTRSVAAVLASNSTATQFVWTLLQNGQRSWRFSDVTRQHAAVGDGSLAHPYGVVCTAIRAPWVTSLCRYAFLALFRIDQALLSKPVLYHSNDL